MAPDLISVLAEPNRRRLLALLGAGERSVSQLAAQFPVSRSAISQHLAVLVEAGLVEARAEGRFRYYRLVPTGLAALRTEIDHFWTAEVESLAQLGPRDAEVSAVSFDRSLFVPVPPDEAFALVTEPERLRRWGAVAARIDLRAGGDYRWTVTSAHSAAGSVVEVEPGKRVVYTWGWEGDEALPPGASTVTITLAPGDGGTFIRLVHDGLTEEQAVGHAEGWNHYLDRLVTFATTGDAGLDEWSRLPDPLDELAVVGAALAVFQQVAAGATDADLPKATPCRRFDVSQLIDHLDGSVTGLGRAGGATFPEPGTEGPQSIEDRIASHGALALEAWTRGGVDRTVSAGGGEIPGTVATRILAIELLVHAWDLGMAIGRPVDVAPELADEVLGYAAAGIVVPERRDGDFFAAEADPGPDADALDRLVAFTGRTPRAAQPAG